MPKDDVYTITDDNTLSSAPSGFGRSTFKSSRRDGEQATERSYGRSFRAGSSSAPKAASLSIFLWGTGQMYNNQRSLGWLLLLTQGLAIAGHWSLMMVWPSLRESVQFLGMTELNLLMSVAGLDLILVLVMLSNIYQAYYRAEAEEGAFDGCEIPFLSGAASLVMPGWGQILNAQPGKAIVFMFSLCAGLFVAGLMAFTPFLRLVAEIDPLGILRHKVDIAAAATMGGAATMWALSLYDAVLIARCQKRMN